MRLFLSVLVFLFLALSIGCPFAATNTIEHDNVSFDVSPDGETIVFSDADGDLWLYAFIDRKLTRLTESKELESWPSFSPDGKSIVFVKGNAEEHGISVHHMTIDGRTLRRVTGTDQCSDSHPAFSPDGNTIAFSRSHLRRRYSLGGWTWDNWDVYTIDIDGSGLRRQTNGNHYGVGGVAFSANAKEIYFTADESRNPDSKETLFTITLHDSSVVATKPDKSGDYYAWCSEVNINKKGEMAFISDRNSPFHYDIVFAGLDGQQEPLGVTTVSRYNQNPVVTNDGRIIFLAGTAWNSGNRPIFSLWSVNVDGTSPKQLAGSDLFTRPLQWSRQLNATEHSDEPKTD